VPAFEISSLRQNGGLPLLDSETGQRRGEVLASRTVKDLVAGSGLRFEERGIKSLRDVPGDWPLSRAIVDRA